MKKYIIKISLFILIVILTLSYWYFDIEKGSNDYILKDIGGKKIESIFIGNTDLIRFCALDKKFLQKNQSITFFTILDNNALFVNEGSTYKMIGNYFLFSKKSKRINYIGGVERDNDGTLKFNGFTFYNITFGSQTDTFFIQKMKH
ncbi:MAG: hypothetical protein KAX53_06075 [Saprospiraceae bacterium]|nr:hypothetical protein [Saprospiraceae bacterium]